MLTPKFSPLTGNPDLAELSWEDIATPHKTQQTVAMPTAEILQSEATTGQQPKRPGASSSGTSTQTVLAFMSSPSRYGIRTCLRSVRCRLAHSWDSRQESTDLRVGGTLSHAHTSLCGEKRPKTLTEDLNPAWARLSSASPQTIYSGLGVFEEARELQMPLHHTPRDLSTCLPRAIKSHTQRYKDTTKDTS